MSAEPPEAVTAAWHAVEEAWSEQPRHDAFLALVSQHNCFAYAAARYRERAGDDIADRMQDRVRRAATATMFATASRRDDATPRSYRLSVGLLVFLVIAVFAGLAYVANLRVHSKLPPARPPNAEAR